MSSEHPSSTWPTTEPNAEKVVPVPNGTQETREPAQSKDVPRPQPSIADTRSIADLTASPKLANNSNQPGPPQQPQHPHPLTSGGPPPPHQHGQQAPFPQYPPVYTSQYSHHLPQSQPPFYHANNPQSSPVVTDKCPRSGFIAGQPLYPAPTVHPCDPPIPRTPTQGPPQPYPPPAQGSPHSYSLHPQQYSYPPPQLPNWNTLPGVRPSKLPRVPDPQNPLPLPTNQPDPVNPDYPHLPPADGPTYLPRDTPGIPKTAARHKSARMYKRRLTRDERRDILLMRRLGYNYEGIARFLGTTISAVNYTCRQRTAEVLHKNAGRRAKVPEDKVAAMCIYVEEYLAAERTAGVNKKTGKKNVQPLTYNMIREKIWGSVEAALEQGGEGRKVSDECLKSILNQRGLSLRPKMSEAKREAARVRGKLQWEKELAKKRAAEQAARARGEAVPLTNGKGVGQGVGAEDHSQEPEEDDEGGYAEARNDEDEEIFSGTESIPSDVEEDPEDMYVASQQRQVMETDPSQRQHIAPYDIAGRSPAYMSCTSQPEILPTSSNLTHPI